MIDLEKEREGFNEQFGIPEPYECFLGEVNPAKDSLTLKCNWLGWQRCAESKQFEINALKAKLEKIESGEFVVVKSKDLLDIVVLINEIDLLTFGNRPSIVSNRMVTIANKIETMIEAARDDGD